MDCYQLGYVIIFGVISQTVLVLASASKYVAIPEVRLLNVTGSVDARSKLECAFSCHSTSPCISVSWSESQKLCQLSDKDVTDWFPFNPSDHPVLNADSDWVSLGKAVYQVTQYQGPDGRYTLSFEEAGQLCRDRGTVLASTDQVRAARDQGLDLCNCAWFADERKGFVLQAPHDCWWRYDTGILFCSQTKADAWCVLK